MPTDFVDVEAWSGKTWSAEGGAQEMTFLHWLNSSEHLERTAVVYGDSNSGKTAALNGTARTLSMRCQEGELPRRGDGEWNALGSQRGVVEERRAQDHRRCTRQRATPMATGSRCKSIW